MNAYDGRKDSRRCLGLPLGLLLLAGWPFVSGCGELIVATRTAPVAVAPLEEFPFDLLPITLDGKEYLFAVDTGASLNIYDATLRSSLGSPQGDLPTMGAAGNRNLELFAPPDARLGKLKLRIESSDSRKQSQTPVQCMDMSMIRKVAGEPIFGFIGMDFLQRYIVQLDPDAGKIRLFSDTTTPSPEWGTPVPMVPVPSPFNVPCVMVVIGRTQTRFLIDTGNNGAGDLEQDLFDRLAAGGDLSVIAETLLESITGTSRIVLGRVQRLSIGNQTQEGLIFNRGRMNVLGLGFLGRYRVTLDFPHQRLYLRPGKSAARLDYPDMSGLHLIRDEGKTLVHTVDPNSPAHQAGIRTDDEIVQVNGKPAQSYKLEMIRRILASAPGDRVHLQTRRGDQVQDCQLVLRLFNTPAEKKP